MRAANFGRRDLPLLVGAGHQAWQVRNEADLDAVLAWRDGRGGAMFWLSPDEEEFPALAIRVTGDVGDVTYFPQDGHPSSRLLGGEGLPEGGLTTLVYEGCDPGSGEQTPNEFVVPFETARAVAREFLRTGQRAAAVSWFEL
jgi:hypothetical protein